MKETIFGSGSGGRLPGKKHLVVLPHPDGGYAIVEIYLHNHVVLVSHRLGKPEVNEPKLVEMEDSLQKIIFREADSFYSTQKDAAARLIEFAEANKAR